MGLQDDTKRLNGQHSFPTCYINAPSVQYNEEGNQHWQTTGVTAGAD